MQSTTHTPELAGDLSERMGERTDDVLADAQRGTARAARSVDGRFDDLRDSVPSTVSRAVARAEDATRRGLERARMAASEVKYRAADLGDATVHQIQDRPVRSILMAAAFGAAATLLVQWLSRSRHPY